MKSSISSALLCLLLAGCFALLLRAAPFTSRESGAVAEFEIAAGKTGELNLFFDFGHGIGRESVRTFWAVESRSPRLYRLPVPLGDIHGLAIIPTEENYFAVTAVRLLDEEGRTAKTFAVSKPTPKPNFGLTFDQSFNTIPEQDRSWLGTGLQFLAGFAVLFAVSLQVGRKAPDWETRCRAWWSATWPKVEARPRTAIFLAALLAVIASCHPVIFFGKSFASPNNFCLCLYDSFPTVPGSKSTKVDEWNSSDVRALMQAHLPYSAAESRAILRDHELPLWLRENMCGVPLLGQGQAMLGDPLNWIAILSGGAAWAWDVKFVLAKLLFTFGVGLLCWRAARHLGVAILLAVSSAFIGFFSYRYNHPAFFSVSYAPWILYFWLRAGAARDLRGVALCALGLIAADGVELNSGTAKEAAMILATLNAAGLLALLLRDEPRAARGKRAAVMMGGSVLFLALSAPFWMPFLGTLRDAYTTYDAPTAYQIQPGLMLGLFDDLFYRELMPGEWHIAPSANFLLLIGALWAAVEWRKMREERFILACGTVALGLALLVFGAIPQQWILALPLLKNIWHIDNTFSCPLIVLLFVVAAFGLRVCVEQMPALGWRTAWLRTLGIALALAVLYFGSANAQARWSMLALQLAHPLSPSAFFAWYAPALFAALAVLPWAARRLRMGRGSAVLAGAIVAAGLFLIHFRNGMWLETKFDYYVMNPGERCDLAARSPAVDFIRARQQEPGRVSSFDKVLRPGFNAVYGLETCNGADAVIVRRYAEWLEAIGFHAPWIWTPEYRRAALPKLLPFLDAMNVRYYLGSRETMDPTPAVQKATSADLEVFESATAWPRAFFTDRVRVYEKPAELVPDILQAQGKPLAGIQAGTALPAGLGADQASRTVVAAKDYHLTANHTAFSLEAPSAGLAVLLEADEEGSFQALVNGQPQPCVRVNHCFKGVFLPAAGRYQIVFAYWPRLLTPALWISAVGGAALLALAAWLLRCGQGDLNGDCLITFSSTTR